MFGSNHVRFDNWCPFVIPGYLIMQSLFLVVAIDKPEYVLKGNETCQKDKNRWSMNSSK